MNRPPLPMSDDDLQGKEIAPGVYEQGYRKDQMYAYADAVLAAARDCRTCAWYGTDYWGANNPLVCRHNAVCINADRYEPLPPVRLWRKTE